MRTLRRIVGTLAFTLLAGAAMIVSADLLSDNFSNPDVVPHGAFMEGWNGATWARTRVASLATMPLSQTFTSSVEVGRLLAEKPSRWSKPSTPAVSTLASASVAAEASVRHVADTVCFSAASTTAPVLTKLNVNLRDGATGAGTIIASWTVVIPAATGQNVAPICFPDLQLVGTTNTAMTLEYSSLLANLFEDVTLTGWNIF